MQRILVTPTEALLDHFLDILANHKRVILTCLFLGSKSVPSHGHRVTLWLLKSLLDLLFDVHFFIWAEMTIIFDDLGVIIVFGILRSFNVH
jgi:hypothetical protein